MGHSLEIEDILKLLAAALAQGETEWLMVAVIFTHGLRAKEVTGGWCTRKDKKTGKITRWKCPGLMPSNIVGEKLVVKRLKHSNPVEDDLLEHENPLLNVRQPLIALAQRTPEKQRLFPISSRTLQRRIHKYGEMAGLPELWCHPHMLKHSVINFLRKTMDLDELQDRSGHKSLDSLKMYLHPKKATVDAMVRSAFASAGN